ncbi:hypothetical protein AB0A74_12955 [Saccharothrix sp. NPDC042600]|uniref:hypothetical protein n=1 Tax=Saccharothrix TaxID=2071 RepID=UPI0033EFAC44|nr:hypothetical protein GCM10017745_83660 [Saccharothrix mutabilis subsp. capreolus]
MKARLAAAVVAVLLLSPGTATASEALPPLEVRTATATLCPTTGAQEELTGEGIALEAVEPAVDADVHGRRCVRLPVTGRMALDLDAVDVTADGGVRFVRSDGAELRFHSVHARDENGRIVVRATVNDRDDTVEFFAVDVSDISATPTVEPVGLAMTTALPVTDDVAREFEQAFGDATFEAGDELFDGSGDVELVSPVDVLTGLVAV